MKKVAVAVALAALVAAGMLLGPASAAVDPGIGQPVNVVTAAVPLGVKVTWQPPTSGNTTGYRLRWQVGQTTGTEDLGPEQTSWIIDTSTPGQVVSGTLSTVLGDNESEPVALTQRTSTAPGGLLRTPSRPTKLLDTTTGTGIARARLRAGSVKTVQVSGRAGVPATGVQAVWISTTLSSSTRTTTARVWKYGAARPAAATVASTAGRPATHSALVQLGSRGRLSLVHSAGVSHVRIDVLGWVLAAGATSTSRDGVASTVPTKSLGDRKLGGGRTTELQVTGLGGVPRTGVRAVILDVAVRSTTATNTAVSVSAAGTKPSVVSVRGRKGVPAASRVVIRPSATGRVRITNSAGTTVVRLLVSGWVSNGAIAADDAKWMQTRTPALLASTSVARGGSMTLTVAGRGGVPAMTSSTPPDSVVLALQTTTPSGSAPVSVGATTGTVVPTQLETQGERSVAVNNAVWVRPDASGRVRVKNLGSATTKIRVDVVGWTVGSTMLAPGAKVLSGTQAASYPTLQGGTFALAPGAAAPAVGTSLVAGPTANNPHGFLRTVTGISGDATSGYVVVTRAAALDEVLRRGSVHDTRDVGAPLEEPSTALRSTKLRPIATTSTTAAAGTGTGLEQSFSETVGPATLSGSAGIRADANVDIDIGWTGIDASLTLSANEHLDANLNASAEASISYSRSLGKYSFGTFVVQIGPVPVVITPTAELTVSASGSVYGEVDMSFHQSTSGRIGVEYDGDFHEVKEFDNQEPTTTTSSKFGFSASAALTAKAELLFYGTGAVFATLGPQISTGYASPGCFIESSASLQGSAGVSLDLPLAPAKSASYDFTLHTWTLPSVRFPFGNTDCPWTGIITVTSNWRSDGTWRNADDPTYEASVSHSGHSAVILQRVVPDGEVEGYWVVKGANGDVRTIPDGLSMCAVTTATGSAAGTPSATNPYGPFANGSNSRYYVPGSAAGSTDTTYEGERCTDDPVHDTQFYPGTDPVYGLILPSLDDVAPQDGLFRADITRSAADLCTGTTTCDPTDTCFMFYDCGMARIYLDGSSIVYTGSATVTAQLTNRRDRNSDGVPD